jgi:hypothetical protein
MSRPYHPYHPNPPSQPSARALEFDYEGDSSDEEFVNFTGKKSDRRDRAGRSELQQALAEMTEKYLEEKRQKEALADFVKQLMRK